MVIAYHQTWLCSNPTRLVIKLPVMNGVKSRIGCSRWGLCARMSRGGNNGFGVDHFTASISLQPHTCIMDRTQSHLNGLNAATRANYSYCGQWCDSSVLLES